MKTATLGLSLLLTIAAISFGQYSMGPITNFPTNLHLNNHILNSHALGAVNFGGEWSVATNSEGAPLVTSPPASSRLGITYKREIPGGAGNYQTLEVFQDPNHYTHHSQPNPTFVRFQLFQASGVQVGHITYSGTNTASIGLWVHNHPAYYTHSFAWSANVASLGQPFINGWENGVLVGGSKRTADFFKARELMENLSYQDGRWSPAP